MIKLTKIKVKVLCLLSFVGLAIIGLTNDNGFVHTVKSFSSGPPAGFSGAPGENNCSACHGGSTNNGQFTIVAPPNYTPGQTYQIQVRHNNTDQTRRRWGFQLTALANNNAAGAFANLAANTQILNENGRSYIQQTSAGAFTNQTNGALWTFNWTAPAANIGAVTFYAAGNQANNDGTADGDQIYITNVTAQAAPTTVSRVFADFDGDGKSDVSLFRPANGTWYLQQSTAGFTGIAFGLATDKLAPADFDGDGKTDVAVVRNGTWFIQRSQLGFTGIAFGDGNDIPMPADYDGDGKADLAVFRPSNGAWYLQQSTAGFVGTTFGQNGDKPVAADYDGDGKADIAVFRNGTWYLQRSQLGFTGIAFGDGADKPTPADYDGDGKADVAVYRPSNGTWYLQRSQLGFTGVAFGISTDTPVPADYDGDGKTDVAVFRGGTWYLQRSTAGFTGIAFGENSDKPIPAAFVP